MKQISLLIVDDEANVTKLLYKVFTKHGYKVYESLSSIEALEIIYKYHIDVVVTDIRMPEMDGIELLKKIKEIDDTIGVILMTAFAGLDTAIDAMKIGARDYVIKPFNIDEMILSVKRITEGIKAKSVNIRNNSNNSPVDSFMNSKSPSMKKVVELIEKVAESEVTTIVYGETGTGKELAAQAIHSLSKRKEKPFIKVNCGAIPETLLESELFGYEKGAFTGATTKKPGWFELADKGTIFLDEIGDITQTTQVKLLRVIQEKEFFHLGGTTAVKSDVRIIAATNKKLEEMIKKGEFREDLFYRLNVVPINIPSLRNRKNDLPVLIQYFLERYSSISKKPLKRITNEALKLLKDYNWPGNIRELINIIERCVVVTTGNTIDVEDIPEYIVTNKTNNKEVSLEYGTLEDIVDNAEKEVVKKALKECGGNRTKAAEQLGISRRSLHRKLIKFSIEDC